ncbi:MAG: hypothetical protein EAZ97_16385 [Bacteroidetes bacterium]|nr:MAG: hypothetical protein EAZ97_16385 [Bacteroidota bacterium]
MSHKLIPSILLSIILTITCWTIGLFYVGLDLLFLPLMLLLFLIGISGIITIPIGFYRFIKKQIVGKGLSIFIGLSIGFYFGLLLQKPIDNWDTEQRNLSGQILATELENYKNLNGVYPKKLSQLNLSNLNNELPNNYQIQRFTYFVRDNGKYDLDIPIPIFDCWHWNENKKAFIYNDF